MWTIIFVNIYSLLWIYYYMCQTQMSFFPSYSFIMWCIEFYCSIWTSWTFISHLDAPMVFCYGLFEYVSPKEPCINVLVTDIPWCSIFPQAEQKIKVSKILKQNRPFLLITWLFLVFYHAHANLPYTVIRGKHHYFRLVDPSFQRKSVHLQLYLG